MLYYKSLIHNVFKNILIVVLFCLCCAAASAVEKLNHNENIKMERTLSIIKPDGVSKNLIGKINTKFEEAGLKIVAMKMIQLTQSQAEGFYAIHKERPFFKDLVKFMISGPVVVQVLEGVNAVSKNRDIMGATNPADAALGTIRREFASSIDANCVHGSDSLENAKTEIAFFFSGIEVLSR